MRSKFISSKIEYDGSQLRSHFILEEFSLPGDALIAFCGACSVSGHMVDLEDSINEEYIHSEDMLHFIVEHFDSDLERAILRKRLLVSLIAETVNMKKKTFLLERRGNGLYDRNNKKFNVAVATLSPVSSLIHVGVNISSRGTPVPTLSLNDLKIEAKKFALDVMKRYCGEMDSVSHSRTKVKAVQ